MRKYELLATEKLFSCKYPHSDRKMRKQNYRAQKVYKKILFHNIESFSIFFYVEESIRAFFFRIYL